MTLEQFKDKLHKEYHELVVEGDEKWTFFLNNAYQFAHYNEIVDYFDNMEEEDWEENWKEIVGEREEDVLLGIWNSWLNYNHPEYYNFFTYEGLCDIMKYYFEHN